MNIIDVHSSTQKFQFFTESKICEALDEDLHITLTQSFKEPICESSTVSRSQDSGKTKSMKRIREYEGDIELSMTYGHNMDTLTGFTAKRDRPFGIVDILSPSGKKRTKYWKKALIPHMVQGRALWCPKCFAVLVSSKLVLSEKKPKFRPFSFPRNDNDMKGLLFVDRF